MSDTLTIQKDDRGVYTLTLNRPDVHNALNAELISQLTTALIQIEHDKQARVVIITGEGKSFSSGADLQWMKESAKYDEATNRKDAEQLTILLRTLYQLNKPTITRINGPAFGGALGIIAACDIAIADDSALFAFSEVRLGLAPAVISPYILMRIGPSHARKLFMTAERFDATHALTIDLVHSVTHGDKLDTEIEQQVQHLLKAGPIALQACKLLIPSLLTEQVEAELTALIAQLRASPEGQEGLAAFLEKRKPNWINAE